VIFEALHEAAERGELVLVDGGLCRFHLRRDGVCVIREIIVLPFSRRQGIGRSLVAEARGTAQTVLARCPASSPANGFWLALGFTLLTVERTRKGDPLNVWRWEPSA
jgi:GNAT superfamily N-acetyltransferase